MRKEPHDSASSLPVVPDTIHFIHIFQRPFTVLNYASIASARRFHPDWKILIHYDVVRGSGSELEWWNRAMQFGEAVEADIPASLERTSVQIPQHRSDLLRLRLMNEEGGIYLDTDVVLLKSLEPLRRDRSSVSGEGYRDASMYGSQSTQLDDMCSISSAALAFVPGTRFIRDWISKLSFYYGRSWAGHAVDLPYELLKSGAYQDEVEVLPTEAFNPFSFDEDWILESGQDGRLSESFGLHLFESVGRERYLREVGEEWARESDSTLASLLRPYLEVPLDSPSGRKPTTRKKRSTRQKGQSTVRAGAMAKDEAAPPVVPATIHFIHIFDRPFTLLNFVAVASARRLHPDWKIVIHHEEVRGNADELMWWRRATQVSEVVMEVIPTHLGETPMQWPQHRSDLFRLRLLEEQGGVYLDTDVVLLRSLEPLRRARCSIGGEGYKDPLKQGSGSTRLDDMTWISNAAMAFAPGTRFARDWISQMPAHFGRTWVSHSVELPLELLKSGAYQDEVEVLPPEAFCPFHYRDDWILQSGQHQRLSQSFGIHLFESWGRDSYLQGVGAEWVRASDSTLASLLSPYLEVSLDASSDSRKPMKKKRPPRRKGQPTICLNMIVRDEAHVIVDTLSSVEELIDYWVIVDTGSIDSTIDTVREFFAERGIPGEMHERPWRDFGSNRSEALALCKGKADYVFVIDADDLLHGEVDLSNLTKDAYLLRIGREFVYWRKQIFSNRLSWRYEGVLHEYPVCEDSRVSEARIEGDYHIESRRLGGRNRMPDKYARDAELLREAHAEDPDNPRTVFYLAQSCFDAGRLDEAMESYALRTEMGGWVEEVYYSHFKRAVCMQRLGYPWPEVEDAYLTAWRSRTSRAEPLHEIARHHRLEGRYDLGYVFAQSASEIPFPDEDNLFIDAGVYWWRAKDERAISAFYLGKYRESFDLCVELLENAHVPEVDRERILANRDFSVPHVKDEVTSHPADVVEKIVARISRQRARPRVTLTVTSCRRFDLFEKTINSFLNCCTDLESIGRWICIDDGSSASDRKRMKELFPFFEFVFKTRREKGHARSMNKLLEMINSPYWLHLEDDWQFFVRDRYVTKFLDVLSADRTIGQVLFNRHYGETTECRSRVGGVVRRTSFGQRYRLHSHHPRGSTEFESIVTSLEPGTLTVAYWPHYSLQPSFSRMSAIRKVGRFDRRAEHFEMAFAFRYANAGFVSAFLDSINALHIGALTTDSGPDRALNAYDLNDEPQFGVKRARK